MKISKADKDVKPGKFLLFIWLYMSTLTCKTAWITNIENMPLLWPNNSSSKCMQKGNVHTCSKRHGQKCGCSIYNSQKLELPHISNSMMYIQNVM